MGHILEASPNNITNGFNRRSRDSTVALTDANEQVYMFGTGINANSGGSSQAAYTAYTPSQAQGGWGSWNPAQPQGTIFGGTSGGYGNATPEYTYYGGDGGDSSHAGTDSDTESSCGECDTRPEGLSAQLNGPLSHLPDAEKEQHLYWAYKTTKGNWRKFMRKPVRKVRRYFRKEAEGGWKGKGKGQSKSKGKRLSGKGISAYVAELSDEAYEETFFGKGKGKGRGKGKGKRSSGKGMGSRKNPVGRDGTVMKCFGNGGTCGSEFHLKRDCPHETGNASAASPSSPSTFYVGSHDQLWMVTTNGDQPSEEVDYVQDAQLEPSQDQEAPLEVHTEYIFMLGYHEMPHPPPKVGPPLPPMEGPVPLKAPPANIGQIG